MNQRGRPPKPTQLRVLQGNPGKRAMPKGESKPAKPLKLPPVPRSLGAAGKARWRTFGKRLLDLGLLTDLDLHAFELYCRAVDEFEMASEELEKGYYLVAASGYVYQSPFVSIKNNAQKMINTYLGQFGMTPASRSRISISGPDDDDDARWLFGED